MTATQARWPQAPDDARSLTSTDAFDAAVEAVLLSARLDFDRTLGLVDGTRSAQVGRWSADILVAVGGES